jgi:hypothetical protein
MLRYCIERGGYQAQDCMQPPVKEVAALEEEEGVGGDIAVDGQIEAPEWPEPV